LARVAGQIILLGVLVAAAIGIVFAVLPPELLGMMGANERAIDLGTDFSRIVLGSNITVLLIFLINAISRRR